MPHVCKNCLVHCMDFRIQESVQRLLDDLGMKYGSFDRIAIPGGAGAIEATLEGVLLSQKLHRVETLILTVHEDCGAGKTREDLKETLRIAHTLLPQSTIRGFFVYLNGKWEEIQYS